MARSLLKEEDCKKQTEDLRNNTNLVLAERQTDMCASAASEFVLAMPPSSVLGVQCSRGCRLASGTFCSARLLQTGGHDTF